MKKLLLLIIVLMLSGCASLTYQSPDGTKVTYTRVFTAADTIKGKVGDASIESRGQKIIEPAALKVLLEAMAKE